LNVDELQQRSGLNHLVRKMRALYVEPLARGGKRVPVEVIAPQQDVVGIDLFRNTKYSGTGRMQAPRHSGAVKSTQPVGAGHNLRCAPRHTLA